MKKMLALLILIGHITLIMVACNGQKNIPIPPEVPAKITKIQRITAIAKSRKAHYSNQPQWFQLLPPFHGS